MFEIEVSEEERVIPKLLIRGLYVFINIIVDFQRIKSYSKSLLPVLNLVVVQTIKTIVFLREFSYYSFKFHRKQIQQY